MDYAPFPSLAALWAAHRGLLDRRPANGYPDELLDEVKQLVARCQATGALLDASSDRWEAQNLLDYWVRELHQARHYVIQTKLVPFDPSQAPTLDDSLCPYQGLDAFGTAEHDYFFGRAKNIQQMVDALKLDRFLAVVGPSGIGKSSAVLAGLVPQLQAGAVKDSQKWQYFQPFSPGSNPLVNLARTLKLSSGREQWISDTARHLQREPGRLVEMVRQAGETPAVLVVDQFDELFIFCEDDVLRRTFINVLLHLIEAPDARHTVIVTMRTDLESNLVHYPAFQALYEQSQVRMTVMKAAELREAIVKPAELVGLKFEEGLVDELIREVLGDPAALPLLQFALLKLWDLRQGNRITWEAYRRLGGRQALANWADAFYDSLPVEDQEIARKILLTIVHAGEGGEGYASDIPHDRVAHRALHKIDAPQTQVERVLDQLVEARLVRLVEGLSPDDNQVEIAHASLVRIWPRLVGWLEDERVAVRRRRHLTTMAEQWEAHHFDDSALLRGSLLEEALSYDHLNELETAFIAASVKGVHREQLEEEARRERELKQAQALAQTERARAEESAGAARRLSWLVVSLGIVLIVAFASALLAARNGRIAQDNAATAVANEVVAENLRGTAESSLATAVAASNAAQADADLRATAEADAREQRRIAEEERDQAESSAGEAENARATAEASAGEAEAQSRLATARELAAAAIDQLSSDPQLSLLLALEAVNVTLSVDQSTPAEAEDALYRAVQASQLQLTLSGHNDWVNHVAFSPDGTRLATASFDNTVKIWDAQTGQELLTLADHSKVVNSVVFSPDGTRLASAADDSFIIIWDAQTGQRLSVIDNESIARALAYSPDGALLAAANGDGSVRIWNTASNKSLLRLFRHTAPLRDVTFSADGAFFATAGEDGRVIVWETGNGIPLYSTVPAFNSDREPVALNGLSFSPDGQRLVTANDNGTATVWDFIADQLLFTLVGHSSFVFDATYSPDGRLLATASGDGTARVWQASTGQALYTLSGHSGGVNAIAFSPDGSRMATAGQDGTARVWSAELGLEPFILSGHSAPVLGVAFDVTGTFVATGSGDGTAKVWRAESGEVVYTLAGHNAAVNDVAFHPDGTLLATASEDGNARLWDLSTGEVRLPFLAHSGPVNSVAFNSDGSLLATASDNGVAIIWAVNTAGEMAVFEQSGPVKRAVFSPDDALLATAGADGSVSIWNVAAGTLEMALAGHEGPVNDVAFSSDGQHLVSAGGDGTAKVWQLPDGQLLRTLSGHTGPVLSAAFSPDGTRLATTSVDRTVKVWDTSSGQTRRTLLGHGSSVSAVAFSPDGARLATASIDRTAQINELNPIDELFDRAWSRVTRLMTGEECLQYLHGRACVTQTAGED
ncbi:MAG: hypothetical protein L0332_06535 [Chloroflexi bacterium]|nr:hypothetical protein [Chloroflexota bacterium]MCI0575835.1 hypothetical protein [Chloroflexota bacterium]MCI0646562.1 hypothetical protein [Chloroflexota bacterium]MCI0726364.1 hypothetical protein [Chloroflexota bacterium]